MTDQLNRRDFAKASGVAAAAAAATGMGVQSGHAQEPNAQKFQSSLPSDAISRST